MNEPNKRVITKQEARQNRRKFGRTLFFVFAGVFVLVVARFAYISIGKNVQNVNLSAQAQRLYTSNKTITAKRGTIYDANKQPVAEDTSTYSIYAVLDKNQLGLDKKPLYVTDKDKTAEVLARYLPISKKAALKALSPTSGHPFQVEFGSAGQNISLTVKQKIDDEHLTGINFVQQQARLYPNGIFASHLIGLAQPVNKKDGQRSLVGTMGIEQAFNDELAGHNGEKKIKNDSFGYQLPGSQSSSKPVKNGDNVYTTIDSRLQSLLETEMSSVQGKVHANSMNAVLMNAKTGAILAATQRPTFNASNKSGLGSIWRNTLIQDGYEPGSTMKIFTMASSIDSGNYNGNAMYQSGRYEIGGKVVPDWNKSGWGTITYDKGFALSSNVAMAHLEQQMGAKTWKKYINRFKFLQSTNSGLSGELAGNIAFKLPIEQADTSFGQGIQVTALQMMRALSAVGNDGKMMKPYFISKVTDPDTGKAVKTYAPKEVGQPISKATAQAVRKHMEDVVYKSYGIGADYKMKGYRVAAKTGTAQVSNGKAGYLNGDNSYLYSVAGMVPAKHPKYIMYITLKQPHLPGSQTATQLMADIFKPVMARALQDDESAGKTTKQTEMPDVDNVTVSAAKKALAKKNVSVTVIGNGNKIVRQSVDAKQLLFANQRVILLTGGQLQMPDISGWSRGDVVELANVLGIKVNITGSGYVTKQSIAKGHNVSTKQTLQVALQQRN